jgi:hypothetical protein
MANSVVNKEENETKGDTDCRRVEDILESIGNYF